MESNKGFVVARFKSTNNAWNTASGPPRTPTPSRPRSRSNQQASEALTSRLFDAWWNSAIRGVKGQRLPNTTLGGGNSHVFGIFNPKPGVSWSNLTCACIFQMGWFNHQLEQMFKDLQGKGRIFCATPLKTKITMESSTMNEDALPF